MALLTGQTFNPGSIDTQLPPVPQMPPMGETQLPQVPPVGGGMQQPQPLPQQPAPTGTPYDGEFHSRRYNVWDDDWSR